MAKARLLFLPTPGVGHLLSIVEMAKRLLLHQSTATEIDLSVTILVPIPILSPAVSSYISSNPGSGFNIEFEELPSVEPPTNVEGAEDFISRSFENYKPHVKSIVSRFLSSSITVKALVLDLFATTIIDVADELGIPCYIYFASGASFLSLMMYLPTLHEKIQVEFEEMEGEVEVPGLASLPPSAVPDILMNKKSRRYTWFVYHGRRFFETKGIIVNTFAELETAPLEAMAKACFLPGHRTPPVYPIGPLLALCNTSSGDAQKRHECVNWLDDQPPESVVFLCFGSYGCFDVSQVKQMAAGLEQSGHRFLWALRIAAPSEMRRVRPVDANLDEVLPEGFLERTKGRGFVWPSWAPQAQILAHPAVGGFVTHCGWNSCLESLWFGVPMLGWPMYAEQHGNAFLMAKDMGVALELKVDRKNGNFVGSEELEKGVRCLMEDCEEGNRVRAKVREMKLASRTTMEEGGSSFAHTERLVKQLLIEKNS